MLIRNNSCCINIQVVCAQTPSLQEKSEKGPLLRFFLRGGWVCTQANIQAKIFCTVISIANRYILLIMVVKKNVIFEITNLATPKEGLILRISQISFKHSLTKWLRSMIKPIKTRVLLGCKIKLSQLLLFFNVLYTAISRKVVGKNVHATVPRGNMGYDQYTVPDSVVVKTSFIAFLQHAQTYVHGLLCHSFKFL